MPLDKVTQVSQTKPWHGSIPVYAQYTYGIAGERFFRQIKDSGRIMGTKCQECNLVYLPPRIYCERCFGELTEWVEVPNRGVVHTFTLAYTDLDGNRLEKPIVVTFVRFDGVYGGLVHRLGEVEPENVAIGMSVEIMLKPKAERVGSILDIDYFRPIQG